VTESAQDWVLSFGFHTVIDVSQKDNKKSKSVLLLMISICEILQQFSQILISGKGLSSQSIFW
jgi:hypothetical protein